MEEISLRPGHAAGEAIVIRVHRKITWLQKGAVVEVLDGTADGSILWSGTVAVVGMIVNGSLTVNSWASDDWDWLSLTFVDDVVGFALVEGDDVIDLDALKL